VVAPGYTSLGAVKNFQSENVYYNVNFRAPVNLETPAYSHPDPSELKT
jgi:hypothetical protein